jgi:CPA2 family monovalent cation:H+ antiporter-2
MGARRRASAGTPKPGRALRGRARALRQRMAAPSFLYDVAVVTGVGGLTGAAARAMKQPSILGYLFAGLLVGPSLPIIPLFADPARTHALAEFGVILVMFAIGLEFRFARLIAVLPRSGFAALVQIAAMGWAGAAVGSALGWGPVGAAFLGASLAISSTMVVSGLFAQQPPDADVREHVLGILVVQDIVAIVLMATMTALAAGASVEPGELGQLLVKLVAVLGAMVGGGILLVPRLVRGALRVGGAEAATVLAVGLAFSFAALAAVAGFSVALGAFVAGMLVAESGRAHEIELNVGPIKSLFAAIFFVSIGMAVDPATALAQLPLAIGLTALVIGGQLLSVSVASVLSGAPLRRAVLSGLALGQVGELSFILAAIGEAGGVVPDGLLPTLVTVATITCFTTPWLLARGDAAVGFLDHRLPARGARLLAMVPVAVERLQRQVDPTLRDALRGTAIDAASLVLWAAVMLSVRDEASRALVSVTALPDRVMALLIDLAALLVALPLLVGLLRNARTFADAVAREVRDELLGAQAVRAMVHLLLVVGVAMPALAVLRPLVRGPWAEPLVLIAIAAAALVVWRRLGDADHDLRSGAETLALRLAAQAGSAAPSIPPQALLDHVISVTLPPGAIAHGRTLAQLDLRARTGAIVVAIHRPGAPVLLPTGHEHLAAGDVLALTGDHASIEAAAKVLAAEATAGA